MRRLIDFIFPKKKKLPAHIKNALQEYEKLCWEGCLVIPCKKCQHLMQISEHRYTCKREHLMNILWDEYREEVVKIDELVSKKRGRR